MVKLLEELREQLGEIGWQLNGNPANTLSTSDMQLIQAMDLLIWLISNKLDDHDGWQYDEEMVASFRRMLSA